MNLSIGEILAIIAVGLVLFGGKLPDVARNLGVTLKEFKAGMKDAGDPAGDDEPEPEQIIDQDATTADQASNEEEV